MLKNRTLKAKRKKNSVELKTAKNNLITATILKVLYGAKHKKQLVKKECL